MGHQITDLPLPGNTAGTGFWEGVQRAANPDMSGLAARLICGDDHRFGGIACFEIRL